VRQFHGQVAVSLLTQLVDDQASTPIPGASILLVGAAEVPTERKAPRAIGGSLGGVERPRIERVVRTDWR